MRTSLLSLSLFTMFKSMLGGISLKEAEILGLLSAIAEDHGDHLDEALAGEHELSGGDVVVLVDVGLGQGLSLSSTY